MQADDPLHQLLGPRRAAGHVDVDGDDLVDRLEDRVVVEHPAGARAGAHRDHPLRLEHLVVDLAQRRGHLVRDAAGDDQQVGLARRGAERLHPEARDVVARRDDRHHLDRAAGEPERVGPHRLRLRPRDRLLERRQADLLLEVVDLRLELARALRRPEQPLRLAARARAAACLPPFERSLPPDVDVGERRMIRKTRNSTNPNHAELVEDHGERIQEDDLDVEEDEEHRRQVEADREALLAAAGRAETPDSNGIVRARTRACGRVREARSSRRSSSSGSRARRSRRSRTAASRRTSRPPPASGARTLAARSRRTTHRNAHRARYRCHEVAPGDASATLCIVATDRDRRATDDRRRHPHRARGRQGQGADGARSRPARPRSCASRSRAAAAAASSTRSASTAARQRGRQRVEFHGVRVVVDPFSAPYLAGRDGRLRRDDPGVRVQDRQPERRSARAAAATASRSPRTASRAAGARARRLQPLTRAPDVQRLDVPRADGAPSATARRGRRLGPGRLLRRRRAAGGATRRSRST